MSASAFSHSNTFRCADVIRYISAAIHPDYSAASQWIRRSFPEKQFDRIPRELFYEISRRFHSFEAILLSFLCGRYREVQVCLHPHKAFETVKTVSGIAKDFTRLCHAAKLVTQLQKSQFRFDDFCLEIPLSFHSLFDALLNIASFSCFVRRREFSIIKNRKKHLPPLDKICCL